MADLELYVNLSQNFKCVFFLKIFPLMKNNI